MQLTTKNWAARRLLNSVLAVNAQLKSATSVPEGAVGRKTSGKSEYRDGIGNSRVSFDGAHLRYDQDSREVFHQTGRLMLHDVEHDVEYAKSGRTEVLTSKINQNLACSVVNVGDEQLICDDRNRILHREPQENVSLSAGEPERTSPRPEPHRPVVLNAGWKSRSVKATYEIPIEGQSYLGTLSQHNSEKAVLVRQPLLDSTGAPRMALVTREIKLKAPKAKAVENLLLGLGMGGAAGTILGGILEQAFNLPGATGLGLAVGAGLGACKSAPSAYRTYNSTNRLTWEERAIEVSELAGTKESEPGVHEAILEKKTVGSHLAPKLSF